MTKPDERRFRLPFWAVLLVWLVAIQLVVTASWAVLSAIEGVPANHLLFTGKWAVMGSFMAGWMWAIWRVRVGPAGVETPKSYGPVAWDTVREAELCRFFGLPYARLTAGLGRVVRVPLVLRDVPGFVAAVEEFAGPDHPLTRVLWEWMDGDQ